MSSNTPNTILQRASQYLPADFTWNKALLISLLLAATYAFIHRSTRAQETASTMKSKPNGNTIIPNGQKSTRKSTGDIRLSKILVHPIKSCKGTSVQSARYTPEGIENDRKWCFIDTKTHKVLTAREIPKMVLVYPRIEVDDASPHGGSLVISIPEDSGSITLSVPLRPSEALLQTWSTVDDISLWSHSDIDGYIAQCLPSTSGPTPNPSEIFSRFFSREVYLVYKGPRPRICVPTISFPKLEATVVYQDGYPLLVLSEENMDSTNQWVQEMVKEGEATGKHIVGEEWRSGKVTAERFRPNLVFTGAGAFAEDEWEEIAIGHTKEEAQSKDTLGISLVAKCQRCLLPNVSPETGIRDKAVPYKVLMKHRTNVDPQAKLKPCVGVNAAPKGSGVFKVGDWVDVRRYEGDE